MKLSLFLAPVLALAVQARILQVDNGGSGCPQGSKVTLTSDYSTSFTVSVTTSVFRATSADTYKFCQITALLEGQANTQYAVTAGRYSGSVDLGSGASATHGAQYYFTGEQETGSTAISFNGPTRQSYSSRQILGTPVWSPCGADAGLNIKSQLIVDGSGAGSITGSVGGKIAYSVQLTSRRC